MVVAIIALVVSMSGTAVAAKLITGKQIRNRTITRVDISKGTIRGLEGLDGIDGLDGAPGPQGPQGPAGPNWSVTPVGASYTLGPGAVDIVDASCPAGQSAISGGWYTNASGGAFVDKTYDGRSWSLGVDNFDSGIAVEAEVWAFCAPVGVAARAARTSDFGSAASDLAARRAQHAR